MILERIAASLPESPIVAGPLRVDRRERRASIAGLQLDLSPLLMRLLVLLAERPGKLVTRAELKQAVWPYAVRIDTERRLNTAMRALRRAIGDDGASPQFIETVRGAGYRWIGNNTPTNPHVGAVFMAGAALLLASIITAALPSGGAGAPFATMIEAQSALDAWREKPTDARLAKAVARTDAAERFGPSAALHVMKAELAIGGRWDWAGAEAAYRTALRIDPDNADARLGHAWLAASRGDEGLAMREVDQLMQSSVLSGERRASLGWLLLRTGRADLALAACGSTPSINGLSCSHTAAWINGDARQARMFALKLMSSLHAEATDVKRVQNAAARDGYAAFLQWRAEHFLPPEAAEFQRAQVLADAGMREAALAALERSVAAREPLAVKIASTHSFTGLAGDARFRRLRRIVGV